MDMRSTVTLAFVHVGNQKDLAPALLDYRQLNVPTPRENSQYSGFVWLGAHAISVEYLALISVPFHSRT